MDNLVYFADHEKHCKEDPDYTRRILKQHMQILGNDIEKIANLYELMKMELEALLEKEVKE